MTTETRASNFPGFHLGDSWLLVCLLLLLASGLVMMTSASIEIAWGQHDDAFYYLKRQLVFLFMGLGAAALVFIAPLQWWRCCAPLLYLAALLLLALVLVPGLGREVNGSRRWLDLGFISLQASEPAKLFMVVFAAWLLSRYRDYVCNSLWGFLLCLLFMLPPVILLLKEPDFGAVVILMIAVMGMLFLAGVKFHYFVLLMLGAVACGMGAIYTSSYRAQRLESFVQALSDPFHEDVVFGSGYQLSQALIGFGRGEWLGAGLGNSIQKIYFLPEAYTDFVIAVVAEELGAISVLLLLLLFLAFIMRALLIARRNERDGHFFAAWLGYGLAFIFLGQVVINVAVNVGLLPTKGLTLPFFSYGGSSLMTCLIMAALLLRIDREQRLAGPAKPARRA